MSYLFTPLFNGRCLPKITDPNLVGPGTSYPVGLTFEHFIKVWYRVKKWRVILRFSMQSSGHAVIPEHPSFDYSNSIERNNDPLESSIDHTIAVNSEKDFVCKNYFYLFGTNDLLEIDNNPNKYEYRQNPPGFTNGDYTINRVFAIELRGSVGVTLRISPISTFSTLVFNGLYHPFLHIVFRFRSRSLISTSKTLWDPVSSPKNYASYIEKNRILSNDTPDGPNYNVNVNFDGDSFDLPCFFRDINYSGAGTHGSYGIVDGEVDLDGVSIEIVPEEYWPYDPGDGGGPIWDASTGAQLRDPYSVLKRGDGTFV